MSAENSTAEKKPKRTVNRSPKHPSIDLEDAIVRTRELYRSAWDNSVGVEAACQIWGLSFSSSTGRRTISALQQFGLLKGEGSRESRSVKLTERALDIVTDDDGVTDGHGSAVRECALSPASYKKTWERWGPRLPSDDRSMIPWLTREKGFNPNATAAFLRDFRATVSFAGLDKHTPDDQIEGEDEPDNPTDTASGKGETRARVDRPKRSGRVPMQHVPDAKMQDLTIPLRGGGMAVLSVPVPMTSQNYEKLTGWLEWAKDTLVLEDDDDPDAE